MQRGAWVGLFALLAGCALHPPCAAGEATVTPIRVSEDRNLDLRPGAPAATDSAASAVTGLTVRLELEGDGVAQATHAGNVRVTEAADDTGADLRPGAGGAESADDLDLVEIDRPTSAGDEPLPAEEVARRRRKAELDVRLSLPARRATRLARLKGEISLRSGLQEKAVAVPEVIGRVGRPEPIDDPVLKQAGLEVRVLRPEESNLPVSLKEAAAAEGFDMSEVLEAVVLLEVRGDLSAFLRAGVHDEDEREDASDGSRASTRVDAQTLVYAIPLEFPLEERMTLYLDLETWERTVTVPFDLKDVPLP